jgi:hypothetical protein
LEKRAIRRLHHLRKLTALSNLEVVMSKNILGKSVLVLIAGFILTGCGSKIVEPDFGTAPATLKGCEFGPSDELIADLNKAETYLSKGVARALQPKLQAQVSDIVQRLGRMEDVRKQTNYIATVNKQGNLNQERLDAARENVDQLKSLRNRQGMLDLEARQYNAMSGPDVIVTKDSRGSYQETKTFKGQTRDSVLTNQKFGNDAISALAKATAQENAATQTKLDQKQQELLSGNPNFEQVKAFISDESDTISMVLWPALKVTLSEVEQGNKK